MIPSYAADDVQTSETTRSSRLKWVIIVDKKSPTGAIMNAVACVAASTGSLVVGMIGPGGPDADESDHHGLPWAGCAVLAAGSEQLTNIRAKAIAIEGMLVVDMPASAQTNRVYDDYLDELSTTGAPTLTAISLVGERADVDAIVKRLSLVV